MKYKISNQWYIWSDVKNNQIYDKVLLTAEEIHEYTYWNRQQCGHGNKKQQQQQQKVYKKIKHLYNLIMMKFHILTFSSVQSLNHVQLFVTPWTAAHQASLSITNKWSLLKLNSVESVMASNHLINCRRLLLLPLIFPGIRVFSNESVLRIRWPKYWSFSFSINLSMNILQWILNVSRY